MLRLSARAIPCLVLLILAAPALAAAPAQHQPIGRITATFGHTTIQGPAGTRDADLHAPIYNEERIITNGGGVSVLLASRTVVKVDIASSVTIVEGEGQTAVLLDRGTAHLYIGQRPAGAGPVILQDANVRAEAERGVFLAHYNPAAADGYYACEHGQVRISAGGDATTELDPETQVRFSGGRLSACIAIDRAAFFARKKSLDRLGQSATAQGTETFRVRSRTHDTQVALSQLAAAGWISEVSPGNSAPAEVAPASDEADRSGRDRGRGADDRAGREQRDRAQERSDRGPTPPRIETPRETAPPPRIDTPRDTAQPPRVDVEMPRGGDDRSGRGSTPSLPRVEDFKPPKIDFDIIDDTSSKGGGKSDKGPKDSLLPRADDFKPPKIDLDIIDDTSSKGGGKGDKGPKDPPLPRIDDFKPPKVDIDIIDDGGGKGGGKGKGSSDNPLPRVEDFKPPKVDVDFDNSGKGGGKHDKPPKIDIDIINDGGKGKGKSGRG